MGNYGNTLQHSNMCWHALRWRFMFIWWKHDSSSLVCYLATGLSGNCQFSCRQFPRVLRILSLPTPTGGFRTALTTMCFTWYTQSHQLLLLTWQQGVPLLFQISLFPVYHTSWPTGKSRTGSLVIFHTYYQLRSLQKPVKGRGFTMPHGCPIYHLQALQFLLRDHGEECGDLYYSSYRISTFTIKLGMETWPEG